MARIRVLLSEIDPVSVGEVVYPPGGRLGPRWQRDVQLVLDLLTYTGLPVGEIAARTGFKSVYHFSRRVKQATGASPTDVRRERWISPRTA